MFALLTRKADGLIVALSGNLERPLVGQSGTFLEPGSANLITFEVETWHSTSMQILLQGFRVKVLVITINVNGFGFDISLDLGLGLGLGLGHHPKGRSRAYDSLKHPVWNFQTKSIQKSVKCLLFSFRWLAQTQQMRHWSNIGQT